MFNELLIYLFLIMVGDRQGISYYSFDKICSLTGLILNEYFSIFSRSKDFIVKTF